MIGWSEVEGCHQRILLSVLYLHYQYYITINFRSVIILVKAGAPVDQTVEQLTKFLEPGDVIIDGGNEW